MRDSLGWRKKYAVIAPSTNTAVQPEFDDMRPPGVTNHFGRIHIPNMPVRNDDDFNELIRQIRGATEAAVERVITCLPDHLIMGMSAETFWDGLDGSSRLQHRLEQVSGVGVTMGSDACQAALRCYGDIKRIGIITPYMPVADTQVKNFFTACGFEVVALVGLKSASPVHIACETPKTLRDAFLAVNDPTVEALVQVGTNLACAKVAMMAEFWLDKPVIAVNTAIYWHALRTTGIPDKIYGFGSLMEQF
jgi:maleate isomerase